MRKKKLLVDVFEAMALKESDYIYGIFFVLLMHVLLLLPALPPPLLAPKKIIDQSY